MSHANKKQKKNHSLNKADSVDFEKLKDLIKQLDDEISKAERHSCNLSTHYAN